MSASAAGPSFAVVIPMYNEEAGAEECVRRVCAVLADLPNHCSLIVVNDGSSDNTADILLKLTPEFPLLVPVHHAGNRGYGMALRTGIKAASEQNFEYVVFMDSDLTNDPKDIPRFAQAMEAGHDVIKGTRYSGGGRASGVPFYRVAISAVGNRIARFLFRLPLHDSTNGFRAVRLRLLADLELSENRFPIIMEELYYLKPRTTSFSELPVVLMDRSGGRRPTSFVYRPSVFWDYLKYPLWTFLGRRPQVRRRSA